MVNDLIKEIKLLAIPGDVVKVDRFHDGEFEKFQDKISGIELIFQGTKWEVTYWFEKYDDEVKEHEIKEIVAKIRTIHPIPKPKYDFGHWLKFHYLGKTEHVGVVKWIRIWMACDEDVVKYHIDADGVDWCEEPDVISRLVEEPNVDHKPIQKEG